MRPMPRTPFTPTAAALAAGLLAAALPAGAQTLVQLYQTAHGYDAPYQSARASAQASQARADQARAGLLPQLGLQLGAQRNWADTNVGGMGGSVSFNALSGSVVGSQPLFRPANRITWDQGKKSAELAQVQLQGTEQDLIVRLAQAIEGLQQLIERIARWARPLTAIAALCGAVYGLWRAFRGGAQ